MGPLRYAGDMNDLSDTDLARLIAFRHDLHRYPELSAAETGTAGRVAAVLSGAGADRVVTGLGGHGIAGVFDGAAPGPTVLFRCELDALPIRETASHDHASTHPGVAHLCGHDGHMAILAGLAQLLGRERPQSGRVVLLFQPAEETGAGAAAVLADPAFAGLMPDHAFALHNRPGLPLGHVGLAEGPVACASRGMDLRLSGKEAHASDPASGVSPMNALARLMPALTGLSQGALEDPDFTLVTVAHAQMGAPVFGVAPGEARLLATLRTRVDDGMAALCDAAERLARDAAGTEGIALDIRYADVFRHCDNHPEAVAILRTSLDALGMVHDTRGCPMRASEDFGLFADHAKTAMLYLGSGEHHPALHNPDYDFPDALISPAVRLFHRVARDILGTPSAR